MSDQDDMELRTYDEPVDCDECGAELIPGELLQHFAKSHPEEWNKRCRRQAINEKLQREGKS
jgi:hypothetical protein